MTTKTIHFSCMFPSIYLHVFPWLSRARTYAFVRFLTRQLQRFHLAFASKLTSLPPFHLENVSLRCSIFPLKQWYQSPPAHVARRVTHHFWGQTSAARMFGDVERIGDASFDFHPSALEEWNKTTHTLPVWWHADNIMLQRGDEGGEGDDVTSVYCSFSYMAGCLQPLRIAFQLFFFKWQASAIERGSPV